MMCVDEMNLVAQNFVFFLKKRSFSTKKDYSNGLFAHDEVNVHCSPAKKVFFSTVANFIISPF